MSTVYAIAGTLLLLVAVFMGGYYFGGQAQRLSQANASVRQDAHEAIQTGKDESQIEAEARIIHDASVGPLPDVPPVRVCIDTPLPPELPAPAGLDPHAAPVERNADPVPHSAGPDIGPSLVWNGRHADAQVRALQDYITKVCLVPR